MVSCTLKFHRENRVLKPEFRVHEKAISYTSENKYLGYTISSSLSDLAHVKDIFSKFSRTVKIFKSTVKTQNKELLLRFA